MGCRAIIVAFFTFVLLLGVAGAALFHYLGWYSLLAVPVVLVVMIVAARFSMMRLFLLPFRLKGKVLKNARVKVHEVKFVGKEEVAAGEDSKEPRYTYTADVTITPGMLSATPFKLWDPSEFVPASPDSKPSFDDDPTGSDFGSLADVSVFEDGNWQAEGWDKIHGENRILLKFRLAKPASALKLRYYFYDLAEIQLPAISDVVL